jgi:micrococcal nuclease
MKTMRKVLLILSLIFLLCLTIFIWDRISYPRQAYVIEVIDGDTIRLKGGKLLRYLGINTLEIRVKDSRGDWQWIENYWGQLAYEFNEKLVKGRLVRVEYDKKRKDEHGRLLGYVFLDGKFINGLLLKEGLALLDIRYPNFKYEEELVKAFKSALSQKKGIWSKAPLIGASEAHKFIGEPVVVKGKVLDVYIGKQVILIFLPSDLRVVIFKGNMGLFKGIDFNSIKDKEIKVYGLVRKYRGHPEVIIHHPVEMEILK